MLYFYVKNKVEDKWERTDTQSDSTLPSSKDRKFTVRITVGSVTSGITYQIRDKLSVSGNLYSCQIGAETGGTATFIWSEELPALIDGADASVESEATTYTVNITLSIETIQYLGVYKYVLYGFKAVKATQRGGAPLVWFQTDEFSGPVEVNWSTEYQAYTSINKIIPNGIITAVFSTDIGLGQILEVGLDGEGPVVGGGPDNAISITNTTTTPFTCGISEMQGGVASAPCAFPLNGTQTDVMVPVEKVLLMFSNRPINTGTVTFKAYSPGILIDLTAAHTRNINYDINQGWSWGGFSWAQSVAPNQDLVSLLIESE